MSRDELLDKLAMKLAEWPSSWDDVLQDAFPEVMTWCINKHRSWLSGRDGVEIHFNHWLQRRAKLINRPPDSEAPEWARWKYQGPSGKWWWSSSRIWPNESETLWQSNGGIGKFASQGKIPSGHRWQDTMEPVNRVVNRELNPTTSSLTDSQAREYAETTGECSDGKRCGVPPRVGDDAYCADCPNQPTPEEDEAFNAMSAKQEQPHEADARMLDAQFAADMKSHGIQAPDILNAAAQHMQDRAATYDKPKGERSMLATVEAFAATTGVSLTEEQGWHFMALLKLVRSQQGDYRADSYEDGAAYFALMGEAAAKERK